MLLIDHPLLSKNRQKLGGLQAVINSQGSLPALRN
jgi:hypothetical protein